MMSYVFAILFCIGAFTLTFTDSGDAATAAMLSGAENAVTLSLELAGSYLLFMGLLNVAKEADLVKKLSKKLEKICAFLFPGARTATAPIALNIAANMLGLGNAATPFGLKAMQEMQKYNKTPDVATDAMCAFLAVNASALQILPTTMIALRQASGSTAPGSIVLPAFISSTIATAVAIIACKICMKRQ